MSRPSVVERRRMCLLGELPPHFLRLAIPASNDAAPVAQPEVVPPRMISFVPPNTRGRLSITIQEANLVKNYGIVRMDPYCRVRVGNIAFDTNVAANAGRSPVWQRTLNAYLPLNVESIYVQIFDEKAFGPDEVIAWAHIILPNTIFNGDVVNDFFQLSGQQGEKQEGVIHLTFAFQPIENAPQQFPVAAAYEVDEKDVDELKTIFPAVDSAILKCALKDKRGDKDAAVSFLLEQMEN